MTSALNAGALTLVDHAKRLDPNGRVDTVAELLTQTNEILEDAVFLEGNLPTGHRTTIRTGLPAVYWRQFNAGVPSSKSTTAQVDEGIGMLEAYARVDKDLAMLNGNTAAFRLSEDRAFLESMNQTQAQTMFYGNPTSNPAAYLGLAARYGTVSGAGNAQNIIKAGGTTTGGASVNTSVWLVGWGENTVFCTYPKGSTAGLSHQDQGELTIYDGNGNPYQAFQTHYQWKNGLVVKDWRYAVRIANVDVTNLVSGSSAADLVVAMSNALDRIPSMGLCRPAFYMNRTVYSALRRQALNKSANAVTVEKGLNQFGTPANWASFEGVPLRRVDQLINTEAAIS